MWPLSLSCLTEAREDGAPQEHGADHAQPPLVARPEQALLLEQQPTHDGQPRDRHADEHDLMPRTLGQQLLDRQIEHRLQKGRERHQRHAEQGMAIVTARAAAVAADDLEVDILRFRVICPPKNLPP